MTPRLGFAPVDGAAATPPRVLRIRARSEADRTRLALAALRHGRGAFEGSADPDEIWIEGGTPTLDALVAAWLLLRGSDPLPVHANVLATFAAHDRQGRTPRSLPLRDSPSAILDVFRRQWLSEREDADADARAQIDHDFLNRALHLVSTVLERLEQPGRSLESEGLWEGDVDFFAERSELDMDAHRYARDKSEGEVWRARLGGKRLSLLVLPSPSAVRFSEFARRDPEAPGGQGFDLLLVKWPDRPRWWVLSAHPAAGIDLSPVARALTEAERRAPGAPEEAAWYDGERHQRALVAPPSSGSQLSDEAIFAAIRRSLGLRRRPWLEQVTARHGAGPVGVVVAALVAGLVSGGVALLDRTNQDRSWLTELGDTPEDVLRGPVGTRGLVVSAPRSGLVPITEQVGLYDRMWLLVIGIDTYSDPGTEDLRAAVRDADAVFTTLTAAPFAFEPLPLGAALPAGRLVEADASRANIRRALSGPPIRAVGEHDALVVYWAGHGTEHGYLVPHDGRLHAPTEEQANENLAMTEIRAAIDRSSGKHKLLVLDACFSGQITSVRGGRADRHQVADYGWYLREVSRRRAFQILTSGDPYDTVLDQLRSDGHSPFATVLLDTLRTMSNGDFMSTTQLAGQVRTDVLEQASQAGKGQMPVFQQVSGTGDLIWITEAPTQSVAKAP